MLRLINADPNVKVKFFRYRAGGKVFQDDLDYDFPIGYVIEKFSFTFPFQLGAHKEKELEVSAIACRTVGEEGLPGREAREQRANGFLIVDDKDAVIDLTFLPQFEDAPYLRRIFGIIRISNLREVIEWYLNSGKDSPLTPTRDGFETKNEFTKQLFQKLSEHLRPIYNREQERFDKKSVDKISVQTRERLNAAIKELNKYLKDLMGEGEGISPEPTPPQLDPSKPIQFIPNTLKLCVERERRVWLYLKKKLVDPNKGSIVLDTNNPKIEVLPLSINMQEGEEKGDYLTYKVKLKCDDLHEQGKVTALAEGVSETFDSQVAVTDVIPVSEIIPPSIMEFRPKEMRGQPNRKNNLHLYINPKAIPIGRKIKIEITKSHGSIGLLEQGKKVRVMSGKFDRPDLIGDKNIGKKLIPWEGTGWGQTASIVASTKKPDGSVVQAHGRISLEKPREEGGFIKEIKYRNLGNEKCSDLVDGVIYINSMHYLNRVVFGDEYEYFQKIEQDYTAQYRLASLVVEQSVFRLAEDSHMDGRLVLTNAPVTDMREFIDRQTNQLAPKITKAIMTK